MADAIPTLSISTEKICFVVLKAREFDVKDADTSSDEDGSNPADDRMVEVLENRPDDPVDQELVAFIEAMSEDEQVDLVTLTWLGRRDHMHEQANILVENRSDAVSLHIMWDRWALTDAEVEALLRAVEATAVEAAFDPAAATGVSRQDAAASKAVRHR